MEMEPRKIEKSSASPAEKTSIVETADESLDETVVLYKCTVDKKILAEISPVFKEQFSQRWKNPSDGAPKYLNIEEFSPKAQIAFIGFTYGIAPYFAMHAEECDLILELYKMADKYLITELLEDLAEAVDKLKISDTEVFIVMDAVSKCQDCVPLEDLCKKLTRKCAETVHFNQVDVLKRWMEHGERNSDALWMLNQELADLTGTQAILNLKVEKFSQQKENASVCSNLRFISNLPWTLKVIRKKDAISCVIEVGVTDYEREREDRDNWSCKADVELRILSQEREPILAKQEKFEFSGKQTILDIVVELKEVAESGFIKDDTLIVEAEVRADDPQGLSWEELSVINYGLCKNCYYTPCLNGHPVKEVRSVWKRLDVERNKVSKQTVLEANAVNEGHCTFPINCRTGLYYLDLQEIATRTVDEIICYSCDVDS